MKSCYCCSGKAYETCCEPFINGTNIPTFPEQLMRSRYTAYVLRLADYLIETTAVSQRKYYSKKEILTWAKMNTWIKLEILEAYETIVEFKAYYLDEKLQAQIHHEKSTFKQVNGKWYYVDGKFY
ncbi:MAG: preprotein translocase subunit SecA [Flavobacterium sp.]|uniref:YchJ family protein n=1 Tax=Flavobacterium sp. TaxID=239 RepID=UPI000C3844C1|nr:YchJ family protein [Flavobacterium sp.]MBF02456.1 preprotein translocase subunit SecA [Flavobacterium sp.]|tara:strand:- start:232 stop:606 length:375 start_codon:yes stop_codon:yes gene_type:complete